MHSQIGMGLQLSLRFPYAPACTASKSQLGAAVIQKGARSPHTLYPLKIFHGTQPGSTIGGRHVLAETEP